MSKGGERVTHFFDDLLPGSRNEEPAIETPIDRSVDRKASEPTVENSVLIAPPNTSSEPKSVPILPNGELLDVRNPLEERQAPTRFIDPEYITGPAPKTMDGVLELGEVVTQMFEANSSG